MSCSAAGPRRSSGRRRIVFTAKDKPLVGTIPTYEECAGYAEMMGRPVRAVALDSSFKIDLDKFADASKGAGLVFYCNPNNPTATYVGARATRDFLAKVTRESPGTTDPRRRGVLRVRHRSGPRHAHPAGGRESPDRRGAHVLESVRHGRDSHGLRGRPRRHHQEDGGLGRRRRRRRLAQRPGDTRRAGRDRAGRRVCRQPSARATRKSATSR